MYKKKEKSNYVLGEARICHKPHQITLHYGHRIQLFIKSI